MTEKGATTRRLYLPRGAGTTSGPGEPIEGGREINRVRGPGDDAALRPRRDNPADGPGQAIHRTNRSMAR